MTITTSKLRLAALGLGVAGCLTGLPAYAGAASGTDDPDATPSRQQNIGFATGVTIGAVAAGPVGAMLGAAAGAWLGDRYHRQQRSAATLTADLGKSEAQRAQLTAQVSQLDGSLAQARTHGEQLDATLQRTDQLGLDVSFRTGEDGVSVQAMPPLLKLGALVASLPQARLRVAGYADPRGSVAYNEQLSRRRACSVAAVLTAAGVPQERILIEAHGDGEAAAADGDLDAYALERRVTVRVELPESAQVASRD
jgi:outer membrane protein OmpA-like peptidoglycan-associated protein